jgi:hypothetical protein
MLGEVGHDASGGAKHLSKRFLVKRIEEVLFDFDHVQVSFPSVFVKQNMSFLPKT